MVVLFTLLKYCILLPNGGLLEVNVAMKYIIYNKFPYIGFLSKKDEYGNQSMVVDEVLRGRMETRLITKILSFEIK